MRRSECPGRSRVAAARGLGECRAVQAGVDAGGGGRRQSLRCSPRQPEVLTAQEVLGSAKAHVPPRPPRQRRAEPHLAGAKLWLVRRIARDQLRRLGVHHRLVPAMDGVTAFRLGPLHRNLGHDDLHGRAIPVVARQRVRRRPGWRAARAGLAQRTDGGE